MSHAPSFGDPNPPGFHRSARDRWGCGPGDSCALLPSAGYIPPISASGQGAPLAAQPECDYLLIRNPLGLRGAELAAGFEELAWEANGAAFLNLPARPRCENASMAAP